MRLEKLLPAEGESSTRWMLHISSDMLNIWRSDFLSNITTESSSKIRHLQQDFYTLEFSSTVNSRELLQTVFPRWICPVSHQWPTSPHADNFVEKAAQGLLRKFGAAWGRAEIIATTAKLKRVVVGLKGRLLQLKTETNRLNLEDSDSRLPSAEHLESILAVLVDERGLFAGLVHNKLNLGSALSGGLGFLSQNNNEKAQERPQFPSRAGGKIREVLALLDELNFTASHFQNWLELGAAPGGMTQHLLDWGARVTAVDLAEMSTKVLKNPKVRHLKIHAQELESAAGFDALLCDMNGPYPLAAQYVANLARTMASGSLVIFTLKLADMNEARNAIQQVSKLFAGSHASVICTKHLFHNRQEVTIVAERD